MDSLRRRLREGALAATFAATMGCVGSIGDPPGSRAAGGPGSGSGSDPYVPPSVEELGDDAAQVLGEAQSLGALGVRRLSRREYVDTVWELTGVRIPQTSLAAFPDDTFTPFDNDYETQLASDTLVEGLDRIAEGVAQAVLADSDATAGLLGCEPSSPADDGCLQTFVESFGRRVFRRPLTDEEVSDYVTVGSAIATDQGDFYVGLRVVLRAFLEDVNFLYRIEIGEPVPEEPGLFALDDYEMASRLSFLLFGTGPDDALLDLAADRALSTGDAIRQTAASMLEDPRARDRVTRFMSMWLGYELPLPDASMDAAMRQESAALVERVVFDEQRSLLDVFTSDETFVTDALAERYGVPAPDAAEGGWVSYGAGERRGILSHAAFLSNGVKAGQTSPTLRGLYVRLRLACEEVPPPPPELMVNVDEPPPGVSEDACKSERYAVHATNAVCAGCHQQMDPIGFGLERYDALGRYRETEPNRPDCPIEGRGELTGIGTFEGPGELADLLIRSGRLESCFVTQLYRFTMGRRERPEDAPVLGALTELLREEEHRFDALLLDLVSLPGFRNRKVDETAP